MKSGWNQFILKKNNKTKKISEKVNQKQCGNAIALAWLFDVFYEFEKEWVFRTCASIVLFDYKELIVKQFKNIDLCIPSVTCNVCFVYCVN